MKIMRTLGLTGMLSLFCGSVWAHSPMSCELVKARDGWKIAK